MPRNGVLWQYSLTHSIMQFTGHGTPSSEKVQGIHEGKSSTEKTSGVPAEISYSPAQACLEFQKSLAGYFVTLERYVKPDEETCIISVLYNFR